VRERRRESVGRQRLAGRGFAGVGVDRRDLRLPVRRDLLDLRLIVAEPLEVAERDQVQAVTGRADFRIDLEAALQLALVELAEGPVAGQREMPGLLVPLVRREWRRRVVEIGREIAEQRDQQDEREDGADEAENETHLLVRPLSRPSPLSRAAAASVLPEPPRRPRREARFR